MYYRYFSPATSNDANRRKLASNILNLYKQYNLDGIDIDWELLKGKPRACWHAHVGDDEGGRRTSSTPHHFLIATLAQPRPTYISYVPPLNIFYTRFCCISYSFTHAFNRSVVLSYDSMFYSYYTMCFLLFSQYKYRPACTTIPQSSSRWLWYVKSLIYFRFHLYWCNSRVVYFIRS